MKKTIVLYDGQKDTIQGECKPREAMEILKLNPTHFRVIKKESTEKTLTYTLERTPPLSLVAVNKTSGTTEGINEAVANGTEVTETSLPEQVTRACDVPIVEKARIPESVITVNREELLDCLKIACDVIPKQTLMPVLGMVKIEAAGDEFVLSATDLDVSYVVTIPCTTTGKTAFLVTANVFFKEVKALKAEHVSIMVSSDSIQLNERCILPASVTDDFPEIEPVEGKQIVLRDLPEALARVLPAVSTDECRPILNGVCFDLSGGCLVATDGFRLHKADIDKSDGYFTVPRKAATLLSRYETQGIIVNETRLSALLSYGILSTRLIDGEFPDTRNVWPEVSQYNSVSFKANQFLDLIPGVLPVASGAQITLTINGRIDIQAKSDIGSYDWHVPAESSLKGRSKRIAINSKFLVDAIRAYGSDEITMSFPEDYGALVINDQALIMPVREQ